MVVEQGGFDLAVVKDYEGSAVVHNCDILADTTVSTTDDDVAMGF